LLPAETRFSELDGTLPLPRWWHRFSSCIQINAPSLSSVHDFSDADFDGTANPGQSVRRLAMHDPMSITSDFAAALAELAGLVVGGEHHDKQQQHGMRMVMVRRPFLAIIQVDLSELSPQTGAPNADLK
jgi:hypothetical protein